MELPWFLTWGRRAHDHYAERSGRREPICARVGNGGERHGALARDEVEGERAVVTDRNATALVREHDLAVILPRSADDRRGQPGVDPGPGRRRRRRCGRHCRAIRTPVPRRPRPRRRTGCRGSQRTPMTNRRATGSSLRTVPPSPAMYKPPAAGRIAYRFMKRGLSARSNQDCQVWPPSLVSSSRL